MAETTCISCSTDTDLVSVHDELIFDGTEALGTRNSAASLAKYCFNFKIEKLDDEQYEICSTCLGLLIQASTYKEQIMRNMNSSKNTQDAVQTTKRDALLAEKNELWKEVIENNKAKTGINLRKIDFLEIENEARALANQIQTPDKSNIKIINERRGWGQANPLFERPKSLNKKINNELSSLHRDCKDLYLFSWSQSKYKCVVCEEVFSDLDKFKLHIRKHTSKQNKKPLSGNEICQNRDFIKVDVSTMKCRYCNNRYTERDEFRKHLSSAHKIDANYLFERIFPFHLNKDNFKCGICNEVFKHFVNLNKHMNQHSDNFICKFCSKPFATKYRLNNHILCHHRTGIFQCLKCDEQFDSAAKRQYHVSLVHRKSMNCCPYCPEKFERFNAKLKHLAKVHNEEAKKYQCDKCQKKYATSTERSLHIRKVHLGERNHVCGDCGKAYFRADNLKVHMRKHTW